jgi:hypothetical protein
MIVIKTHFFSDGIIEFIELILKDNDLCVLFCPNDNDFVVPESIRPHTIILHQNVIRELYNGVGYINPWLSNHWANMWFYRNYPNYDYYWFVEYDVRISGDMNVIWSCNFTDDLIHPMAYNCNNDNKYSDTWCGSEMDDKDKRYGWLQLARYSNRFLKYLDFCFRSGINGYDEMIIFTLLFHSEYTNNYHFLGNLIGGVWCSDKRYSDHNYLKYKYHFNNDQLRIFHPIK